MKNKAKFKVTPAIQIKIAEAASKLPPVGKMKNGEPVYKDAVVPGTEVRATDLKEGQPIIRNASYKIKRLVYEDHFHNMVELVKMEGEEAIGDYVEGIMSMQRRLIYNAKVERSGWNKISKLKKQIISWLKKVTSNT